MHISDKIDQKICFLVSQLTPLQTTNDDEVIYTKRILYHLANATSWEAKEIENLNFLSKCFDISKKFWTIYDKTGRKASSEVLSDNLWIELWVAILLKAILTLSFTNLNIRLKYFNVLYKVLDIFIPSWIDSKSELGKECELALRETLKHFPSKEKVCVSESLPENSYGKKKKQFLKTLPLTILFYEGPIARAYLETIYSLGYKPEKIIALTPERDLVTKKELGKWMPHALRRLYASSVHYNRMHYWSRHLQRIESKWIQQIESEIEQSWNLSSCLLKNARHKNSLSYYSDQVEFLFIENLTTSALYNYLSKKVSGAILYTGGGIVPESLLKIFNLKWLHIHPGYLPFIRGADCTLWSLLQTGHASATCFYMSPGIDMGDVIQRCWLPKISFPHFSSLLELKMKYRAIYSFVDPWIRAFVLKKILCDEEKQGDFLKYKTYPQKEEDGITYHFMHEKLQAEVLTM